MAFYEGEEHMLIDIAPTFAPASPSEAAYIESFHARYPARPFRLFDLPRELRDSIYDFTLVDTPLPFKLSSRVSASKNGDGAQDTTTRPEDAIDEAHDESDQSSTGVQATIRHRAVSELLQASKVVKQEYEERAQSAMSILLKDHDRFVPSIYCSIALTHEYSTIACIC